MINENLNLPFDRYTRNKIIGDFINNLREINKQIRILDVGGRSGDLRKFLQEDDELYILDIRNSESNEKNYFLGNITNAPFKDLIFDVVVSSELFEHLTPENREKSLSEMFRMSKNFVILGAPFYSKEVYDAEIKANDFFRKLANIDHPWLDEHIKNGLPKQEDLKKILLEKGYNFYIIENNNILNWLLMQSFIFYTHTNPVFGVKIEEVFRFYNENFLELGDSLPPTYRKIYFISKGKELPQINHCNNFDNSSVNILKYETLLSLTFMNIGETINVRVGQLTNQANQLTNQVNQLTNQIQFLKNTIESIYKSITWRTVMKFQNMIEIIFPGNTSRRRFYDIGFMAIRTISDEGWSAFFNKSLRFLQKKKNDTKISRVPILVIKAAFVSPIFLDKKLYCIFQSNVDKLTEIRILTTTYQRKNADISFILRLGSEKGDVLRKVKIPGRKILDNAYTSFEFKSINDSKGKNFCFEIKSTGKPSAAVWYDADQITPNIDLYCDDKKLQGSINIQAFSAIKNKDLYEIWISCNEPNEIELKKQKNDAKEFDYRPLISIVTPVYNTTPNILKETIQSVLKQTYDNWELCIVDGNSKGEELKNILTDFSKIDTRIRVDFLDQNLGISGNSNKALQFAKGEFVSLLDHDDLLAPFALFEMVKALNQYPELDFIYSDKDIISEDGKQRLQPLFKPDWSPEIMLSANYLTHLCVIRKSLVDKMEGFLPDTDGAQDWDLFMRVTENTNKIHHISKVLYHWRESETSCALWCSAAKPYIFDAQRNVLHNHLKRLGKSAELILIPPDIWRIKWVIKDKTKISIIIPTKDNIRKLRPCVESILNRSSYQNFEIIIIDTGSKEPESLKYYDKLSIDQKIKIINFNQPFNYSAVNNLGEKHATGEILLFLNDDTEVITSDWLEEMAGWIQQEEIGVVGAKLLKPDNTIQHAGVILGMQGFAGHPFAGVRDNFNGPFGSTEWYRDYLAITGACMMVRKKVFEDAGGFNESFLLMGSDVELCLRLWKKGYRIVYTPFAKLVHHEASTRSKYIPPQDFIISYENYESFLKKGDPYFNINLSLWNTIPDIRMLGEKETSEYVQEVLKGVSKL